MNPKDLAVLLSACVGQKIPHDNKSEKTCVVINLTFVGILFTCLSLSAVTLDTTFIPTGYSFISLMNPFTVLYTMPTCACILSLSITYWRRELRLCYQKILHPTTLQTLIKNHKNNYNLSALCLMIITTIATLSLDVYRHYTHFTVFNWVCFYLPGIAVSASMLHITNIISAATYNYKVLNRFLEPYTHRDLTPAQKLKLSEKYEVPVKLMQKFPGASYTIFHQMFVMHDEISRVVRLANKIAGFKILLFYATTAPIILTFIYNITMDIKTINNGGEILERIPFSCDYWAIIYLLVIFLQVTKCASLQTTANETKLILQQIQQNYLGINDMAYTFALQLSHGKIKITAAEFFVIDGSAIFGMVGAWITYLIFLIQVS